MDGRTATIPFPGKVSRFERETSGLPDRALRPTLQKSQSITIYEQVFEKFDFAGPLGRFV